MPPAHADAGLSATPSVRAGGRSLPLARRNAQAMLKEFHALGDEGGAQQRVVKAVKAACGIAKTCRSHRAKVARREKASSGGGSEL